VPKPPRAFGASLPFVEHQAEDAVTDGTIIGPTWQQNEVAVEASGRRALTLRQGQSLEFTLTEPANSILVRYSIPNTPDSSEYTVPLGLVVAGEAQPPLPLTNAYTWRYGEYQFTKDPADGKPQHFFDEAHRLLDEMPAGTKVRLEAQTPDEVTIDLADFELVAAPGRVPAEALSVLDFGADPSGRDDAMPCVDMALENGRATGRPVWIPPGTFRLDGHLIVDEVTLLGAGMWHSVLIGEGVGVYGKRAPEGGSRNVRLSGFAIRGDIRIREDNVQANGLGGALSDSTVSDLWIEHTKVGAWLDGPLDNLTLENMRIRNQIADGVNFHGGVTRSTVRNSHIRGVGDDGLAIWSHRHENAGNSFVGNTVELIYLANGIALYGGRDNEVRGNLVKDAGINEGGGIHVGNRFDATPVAGITRIVDNVIVRSGNFDRRFDIPLGALWFWGKEAPLGEAILVSRLKIETSPTSAITFLFGHEISGVELDGVTIDGVGGSVVESYVAGSARFTNVRATAVAGEPRYLVPPDSFTITDGAATAAGNAMSGTATNRHRRASAATPSIARRRATYRLARCPFRGSRRPNQRSVVAPRLQRPITQRPPRFASARGAPHRCCVLDGRVLRADAGVMRRCFLGGLLACGLLVASASAVANARAASQPVSPICAEDAQALKSFAEQQPVHATLRATALRLAASYEKRRSDCGLTVRIATARGSAAVVGISIAKRVAGTPTTTDVLGIAGLVLAALALISLIYYQRRRPRPAASGA
jgi:hypothetical protein